MRKFSIILFALVLTACGQGEDEQTSAPTGGVEQQGPAAAGGNGNGASTPGGGVPSGPGTVDPRDPPAPLVDPETEAPLCLPRAECDAPLALPERTGWRHPILSGVTARAGKPQHRGRDLFLREGDPQWVIGKFAYSGLTLGDVGFVDDDIKDEEVQLYLLRGCKGPWERISPLPGKFREDRFLTLRDRDEGSALTVSNDGGRIFVNLADTSVGKLGVGRHRIRMVVSADHSAADVFLEVLPQGARIAVSDVDGTLTTSELASMGELVGKPPPLANPGAAEVLQELSRRGYFIYYVTARPEWFIGNTRAWLELRRFPPGLLRASTSELPQTGSAAVAYKTREFELLKQATGLTPGFAFGNTDTDLAAYKASGIPASRSFFFKHDVPSGEGYTHTDYSTLLPTVQAEEAICH